jgi:hypothetical protein
MRGARRIAAAALAAFASLARAEGDTLERGAVADASLEERLKAKARTIEGTQTRYIFAGYAQLDALATRRALTGDEHDTFLSSAIPFDSASRDTRLSIRASQFNAILQTPTEFGGLTAHFQADLFAYDEGARPNVTQAVLRFGEWLTAGKTYSTFMDDAAWPSTLDYNGPGGAVFSRQFVLRASAPLAGALRLDGALEDPQADASAGANGFAVAASAERPDVVARLRFEGERVHAQLAALSRSVTYSATLASAGSARRTVSGTGVSAAAAIGIGEGDRLLAQWNRGEGIGRYYNDGLSGFGAVVDGGGGLDALRMTGAYLYYERKWAERWTSTGGVSSLRSDNSGIIPTDLKRARYASLNLVHRMSTDLFVGAEALWGDAERVSGARANDARVQLTARYYLY